MITICWQCWRLNFCLLLIFFLIVILINWHHVSFRENLISPSKDYIISILKYSHYFFFLLEQVFVKCLLTSYFKTVLRTKTLNQLVHDWWYHLHSNVTVFSSTCLKKNYQLIKYRRQLTILLPSSSNIYYRFSFSHLFQL